MGSGGLRYRFDPRLLSGNPSGCEPGWFVKLSVPLSLCNCAKDA